jgi:hypothetical protein
VSTIRAGLRLRLSLQKLAVSSREGGLPKAAGQAGSLPPVIRDLEATIWERLTCCRASL